MKPGRQRPLESEFALFPALSHLFHFMHFVQCEGIFLELISKDCIFKVQNCPRAAKRDSVAMVLVFKAGAFRY